MLVSETTFNAFPVVVSKDSKRLVGLVYRKELVQALSEYTCQVIFFFNSFFWLFLVLDVYVTVKIREGQ